MTKKDYIAIAAVLAKQRTSFPTEAFNDLVAKLVTVFKADNPRFDEMRFYNACKPLSIAEQDELLRDRAEVRYPKIIARE